MEPNSATASPFTANVLAGWEPVHAHIRYPVTMSLYREGPNYMMFMAPMSLVLLQSLLPIAATDRALIVSSENGRMVGRVQQRSWSTIGQIHSEADIIHLPQNMTLQMSEVEQIYPLLVAPDHAVPHHWGSRLAIGFHDHCHATIITPDRSIIKAALTGFISAYIQSVIESPVPLPLVPTHAQETLLSSMLRGECTEIRFQQHPHYWTIDFDHEGTLRGTTRWVAPAGKGYWRVGWSW